MAQLVNKIKNAMRKKFRIVKNELSEEGLKAFHPLRYRIEQRHTILFFIHWWGTPEFEPPHLFENDCDAMKHIKKHHPNAVVLELMPFQIIENNQRYGFYQWKGFNSQGETYCFEYKSNTGERLYETIHWNNPIDAAFEMVCWLLENRKL